MEFKQKPVRDVHSSILPHRQKVEATQMSVNRWVDTLMWSVCTMEYCSAVKRNEMLPNATVWMSLENISLSKKSQSQRPHIVGFHVYERSGIGEPKDRKQISGCLELGEWQCWGVMAKVSGVSSFLLRVIKMIQNGLCKRRHNHMNILKPSKRIL